MTKARDIRNGRSKARASQPIQSIDRFIGMLAGKTGGKASIDEMNAAAARGWSGRR